METVIRSPQNGTIAKLVHKAGVSDFITQKDAGSLFKDICKAGTVLVLFEEVCCIKNHGDFL